MTHNMRLWDDAFKTIKEKTKTIELRLNDEKRQAIRTNDLIVFENVLSKEKLSAMVVGIQSYKDFEELYSHYHKIEIGYGQDEQANPKDMERYYSKEEITKFGVLAIRIKVID